MPRTMNGKGRHVSYNADGELCMTVVDPVTRKLLIPSQYIFDTRAEKRSTLPSLCQLFLSGRCRQGRDCYQVHADWEAVQRLRAQVDSLPCCCPSHGDKDHLGVMNNTPLRDILGSVEHHQRGYAAVATTKMAGDHSFAQAAESTVRARDVVVYVPGCSTYEGGYVPLGRVSYTIGLRRLLEEQQVLAGAPSTRVTVLNPETGFPEDKIMADASASTVCRLHAMDRCRYAEECKFLHLCKNLTTADPQLTAPPAATSADCATNAPELSFDASVTSPGMSLTTGMGASSTSVDRRGKNAQSTLAIGVRQSVFTSISMLQQQQQQRQRHSSPGVSIGDNSLTGRPLLVPQREERVTGGGAAVANAQDTPLPFLSKSLPSYHAAADVSTPSPLNMVEQPCDNFIGDPVIPMAASVGSFADNNYSSPPVLANTYVPSRNNNGRIRVALGLPAVNSPYISTAVGAGLETSNSSEKTLTPSEETLAAMGGGAQAGSLGQCGLTRPVSQGYGASSNPGRWHHNPYGSSLSKCEVPSVGSYSSYGSYSYNGHPGSNGLFAPMTR